MPTNNIIVLGSYFNLTNKSNLIDRLQYDLIRFFDNLVVAYFFGHTVYWSVCMFNPQPVCIPFLPTHRFVAFIHS